MWRNLPKISWNYCVDFFHFHVSRSVGIICFRTGDSSTGFASELIHSNVASDSKTTKDTQQNGKMWPSNAWIQKCKIVNICCYWSIHFAVTLIDRKVLSLIYPVKSCDSLSSTTCLHFHTLIYSKYDISKYLLHFCWLNAPFMNTRLVTMSASLHTPTGLQVVLLFKS